MFGIVYYEDDPEKKVFRIVYPSWDDNELDEPVTNHVGVPYRDARGRLEYHTTYGVEPGRKAVMQKVPIGTPQFWVMGNI